MQKQLEQMTAKISTDSSRFDPDRDELYRICLVSDDQQFLWQLIQFGEKYGFKPVVDYRTQGGMTFMHCMCNRAHVLSLQWVKDNQGSDDWHRMVNAITYPQHTPGLWSPLHCFADFPHSITPGLQEADIIQVAHSLLEVAEDSTLF